MKLLGIDYGTTSVKAQLVSESLDVLDSALIDYTLISQGATVEFEAEKYIGILKDIISKISEKNKPDALAIDTQCETLILTDEHGVPVRPAIVWLDNRATEEAEIIEKHFTRKKVYEITGQPEVTATWPACKLFWVKRHEPEVWAKTKKVFLLEDFLLYHLTGRFVTEKTLQSSSVYFDIKCSDWWDEMLDFIGVSRTMLPELIDSGVLVGEFDGIKVVTSAMDQVAGAVGAGVVKKGIISEMTGTTMAIYVPTDKVPEFREDSFTPCHYSFDNSYCLLSWSPTAGMALKWYRDAFLKDMSFRDIDAECERIPVGCDGVVFLPYLCGSTMPKYNPDARGSFTGLTTEHTPFHLARSIMESVACVLKNNLDSLGVEVDEIRVMGGGSKSPLWCQMKSDMTGVKLTTLENSETACLGSAILAGVGIGVFESVNKASFLINTSKSYKPSGKDYSRVYESFVKYDDVLNVRKEN